MHEVRKNSLVQEKEVETVKISDLAPHKKNPRKHSKDQIDRIAESIKKFGWTNPLVISSDGVVLAGHGRLAAAKSLGMKEVPVIRIKLSGARAEAYMVADNRIGEATSWDYPRLREILVEMDDGGFDVDSTGFTSRDLAAMMDKYEPGLQPLEAGGQCLCVCARCGDEHVK